MSIQDVIVPKAGLEGDTVEIVALLVAVGDAVEAETPIAEVEGSKLSFEVTSPAAGVVTELLVDAGDEIDAGEVIARIETS